MKPALTVEEWKRFKFPATTPLSCDAEGGRWSEVEQAHANDAVYMLEGGLGYRTGAIHGVAARLLHDQPFGFTREDLAVLRDLIADDKALSAMGDPEDVWIGNTRSEMKSLADRIEALLPPEEE